MRNFCPVQLNTWVWMGFFYYLGRCSRVTIINTHGSSYCQLEIYRKDDYDCIQKVTTLWTDTQPESVLVSKLSLRVNIYIRRNWSIDLIECLQKLICWNEYVNDWIAHDFGSSTHTHFKYLFWEKSQAKQNERNLRVAVYYPYVYFVKLTKIKSRKLAWEKEWNITHLNHHRYNNNHTYMHRYAPRQYH